MNYTSELLLAQSTFQNLGSNLFSPFLHFQYAALAYPSSPKNIQNISSSCPSRWLSVVLSLVAQMRKKANINVDNDEHELA